MKHKFLPTVSDLASPYPTIKTSTYTSKFQLNEDAAVFDAKQSRHISQE